MGKRSRAARKEVRPYLSASPDGCERDHYTSVGHSLLIDPRFNALKPTTQMIYLRLADWAAGRSSVTMSYRVMQQQYGVARATFHKAVEELRDAGFLEDRSDDDVEQFKTREFVFSVKWKARPIPEAVKKKPRGKSTSASKF